MTPIYKLNFVDDKTNLFVTIGLFVVATFKLLLQSTELLAHSKHKLS